MSGRTKLGMGLTQTGSDEGGSTRRTSQQISNYSKRKRSPIYKKTPRGKIIKIGMLSGGQSKLDKNKNNKIDAEDFALLRKEKKSKDPKVMKAKRGKFSDLRKLAKAKGLPAPLMADPKFKFKDAGKFPAVSAGGKGGGKGPRGMGKIPNAQEFLKRRMTLAGVGSALASPEAVKKGTKRLGGKGRVGTVAALGAVGVGAIAKEIKKRMDKRKAKKRDAAKVKKMGGGMMKKYDKGGGADTGTMGERKSMMGVAMNKAKRMRKGLRLTESDVKKAQDLLKSSKKMGGGMMQRPMGMAKKGKMIKARGGGMAKTKPTAMY